MTTRGGSTVDVDAIDGRLLHKMLLTGFASLSHNKEYLDSVNIFPVSDNDTGTNMKATFEKGVSMLEAEPSFTAVMSKLVKGLLLGSRGNSGLILSQYFWGIHEYTKGKDVVTAVELGGALQYANQQARKAVINPTEGTILTVMRDGIDAAAPQVGDDTSVANFFDVLLNEMFRCTQATARQMDVLRDNNVVDSGALGLYVIFDGMRRAIHGDAEVFDCRKDESLPTRVDGVFKKASFFRYCTECAVNVRDARPKEYYVKLLEGRGDSIVVALDGDILKVHIHTSVPRAIIDEFAKFGNVLTEKTDDLFLTNEFERLNHRKHGGFAVVAFTSGEGNAVTLESLGADVAFAVPNGHSPSEDELKVLISGFLTDNLIVFAKDAEMRERLRRIKWFSNQRNLHVAEASGVVPSLFALSSLVFSDDVEAVLASLENLNRQDVFQVTIKAKRGDESVRYSADTGRRVIKTDDLGSLLDAVAGEDALARYSTVVAIGGADCKCDEVSIIRAHFENNDAIEFTYFEGQQGDSDFVIGAL